MGKVKLVLTDVCKYIDIPNDILKSKVTELSDACLLFLIQQHVGRINYNKS